MSLLDQQLISLGMEISRIIFILSLAGFAFFAIEEKQHEKI